MWECEYICKLDEESKKKAQEELNEDPKERTGAVQAFKDWINQQIWLKTPTDDIFLLAILRAKKFSQLRARNMIETMWKAKTKIPQWFVGIDPGYEKVQKFWEAGVFVPLPKRNNDGRQIVIVRIGKIDSTGASYTPTELVRGAFTIFDYLLMDENLQVNGIVFVGDMTGITMKQQSFFGVDNTKSLLEFMQNAMPARIKTIHFCNTGPLFEYIFSVMKLFINQKVKKRIYIHDQSLLSLYKYIDMSLLPDEYLPDEYTGPSAGSIEDILSNLAVEMKKPNVQKWIELMHRPEWGVNLSLKVNDEPQASFRKLNNS